MRPRDHAVAWLAAASLALAACSTDEDRTATSAEPTVTDPAPASSTAAPTQATTAAPAATGPLVFDGTYANAGNSFRELADIVDGHVSFALSGALRGDLTGHRAIVGSFTPEGTEGSAVLVLSSPQMGEGVLASQFRGVITSDELSVTGDLIGVSGAFADLVGTITTTGSPGADSTGTYRIELEPARPSPTASEPTETMTLEYVSTSTADIAWRSSATAFGGASTLTGDVVGSNSIRSNDSAGLEDLSIVHVCTCKMAGEGDGVFIARLRSGVGTSEGFAWEAEFFGVSGAFAGLRGVGTATTTATLDATGAWAPITTFTFELSR